MQEPNELQELPPRLEQIPRTPIHQIGCGQKKNRFRLAMLVRIQSGLIQNEETALSVTILIQSSLRC